jgi:hypothetical protein
MAFLAIGALIAGDATIFGIGVAGAIDFAVTIAATTAISYAAQALAGKPAATTAQAAGFSTQGTINAGGAVPRSFPLGLTNTAGSLVYANTWGQIHPGGQAETPNAYLTQVIALSDLPGCQLQQLWVNGALVTLSGEVDSPGTAVVEYTIGAQPYLWIKYYDGTQTTADTFLTGTVASSDRPYDGTRVGTGVAYAIVTTLVNDTLFTGFPTFKFTLSGIPLYDPTKDSTNGGSGSQVFSNPATWGGDGDDMPAVQAYNILRGIRYNGAWFYGLQLTTQANLPSVNWNTQIGKCRATVTGVSGPEPTYLSGGQITVSSLPADALDSLMTACHGKITEVGGTYKVQLGIPDSFSAAFTDDDILSTENQTYTPFLTLANSINGITGTYPDPTQAWQTITAPPLYNTTFEAQDGSRRLLANPTFDLVPYAEQVQRLMSSALNAARQERSHTVIMPPPFWAIEPGDTVRWNSVRNGYIDKDFVVTATSDQGNCDVGLSLLEIDPTDYDWDHGNFRAPTSGPTTFLPVPPQGIIDWFAVGTIINDSNGSPRRPAIALSWDGNMPGVVGVQYEVRLKADSSAVTGGRTDQLAAGTILISESLLPNTLYQARGQYLPSAPRDMLWSDWLDVTTPNVLFSIADFDAALTALVNQSFAQANGQIAQIADQIAEVAADQDAANRLDKHTVKNEIVETVATTTAAIDVVSNIATSTSAALSTYQISTNVTLGTLSSNVSTLFSTTATTNSTLASLTSTVTADVGSLSASVSTNSAAIATVNGKVAGQYTVELDSNNYVSSLKAYNDGSFASWTFVGNVFQVAFPGQAGGAPTTIFQIGTVNGSPAVTLSGNIYADGTVTARNMAAGSITAGNAALGPTAVNSLNIAGNAVTVPVYASASNSVAGTGAYIAALSFNVPVDTTGLAGQPMTLFTMFNCAQQYGSGSANYNVELLINNVPVQVLGGDSIDASVSASAAFQFSGTGGIVNIAVQANWLGATGLMTLTFRTLFAMVMKR